MSWGCRAAPPPTLTKKRHLSRPSCHPSVTVSQGNFLAKAEIALPRGVSASYKPTTEFAQPCLSRVKGRLSPARGYKFGCGCSYMAGHYPGIRMTGHIGTNTPTFLPPPWGRPPFDPTQTGLCRFGRWVWSSLSLREAKLGGFPTFFGKVQIASRTLRDCSL